jgi:hypothetical protein
MTPMAIWVRGFGGLSTFFAFLEHEDNLVESHITCCKFGPRCDIYFLLDHGSLFQLASVWQLQS